MKEPRKIVFATNNIHKLDEIRHLMGDSYRVMSLSEIGCHDDIPETADTLEGNAAQKARYIKEHYGYDCFADDTGLFVEALDGAPGVYSARYAGEGCTPADNVRKMLAAMERQDNRRATFRTVIACVKGEDITFHEGKVDGFIEREPSGTDGFGYDPIFRPEGYDVTFAAMTRDEKNTVSHRSRAVEKFVKALD